MHDKLKRIAELKEQKLTLEDELKALCDEITKEYGIAVNSIRKPRQKKEAVIA
jgi:hypothetical protein